VGLQPCCGRLGRACGLAIALSQVALVQFLPMLCQMLGPLTAYEFFLGGEGWRLRMSEWFGWFVRRPCDEISTGRTRFERVLLHLRK
jgi:hypothetical protein